MKRIGSRETPGNAPGAATSAEPALRDAAAILARAAQDEAAADQARHRYRTQRMEGLEPDPRIAPLLSPREYLVALRRSAMFDRRQPASASDSSTAIVGDLYLTERRLILMGRVTLSFGLDEIEDVVLSGERLLLVMRGGLGVSLDVGQPRLLRVEIATARALARD